MFGTYNIRYIKSSPDSIRQSIQESDLIIGAVYVIGKEAPHVITQDMIEGISPGTVMVDISIDQGGCFETSKPTTHDDPTFLVNNVVHYCVTNMPGAVPLTASLALNKATLPYIKTIANKGVAIALEKNPGLKNGLNMSAGKITHAAVKETLKLSLPLT
jgi:alanine dehydrogenase